MRQYHTVKKNVFRLSKSLFTSRSPVLGSEAVEGAGLLPAKEAFGLSLLSCSQSMERFGNRRTTRNEVLIIKDNTKKRLYSSLGRSASIIIRQVSFLKVEITFTFA